MGSSQKSGPAPATDLAGSLRQALQLALPGAPDVDWGARAAGLSRRTFQRRLAEHGLTWAGLLEEVRIETARREISGTALPIRQVARRSGYRDPANFTRAFRRWTGTTPEAFRRRSRPRGS